LSSPRTRLGPLRIAPFRRLAASYAVNELGDWVGAVALAVLVYDRTGDPLALTALFVASKLVPAFAAPALTARLDQLAVRRSLPAVYMAEAAAFATLALFADDAFLLPAVLVLALVDGCLALTGRALSRAAVAATLEGPGLLREGNAIVNVAFAAGTAGGPALGGVVVAVLGVSTALVLDALSFLAIAALLATARGLPDAHPAPEHWVQRVRDGLAYVRGRPSLRLLLGAQAAAFVFFTTVVPIEVVYAKDSLGTGDRGFGLLLAAWGGGVVLGSLVFAATRRGSMIGLLAGSTALVGVAYLGLATASGLLVACLISVAGGVGNGIQWVAVVTAVQQRVEQDMQARVVGLLESLGAAMPGLGFIFGGVIASAFGARAAYAIAGGGVLAVLALAGLALRRATGPRSMIRA
jgi:predicted MFS family arabinose efflux permease